MRSIAAFAAATALAAACAAAPQAQQPPTFDGPRAFADLKAMVEIGPRPSGSPAIEKTRDYIRKQLAAAGLKAEDQAFDAQTPTGVVHMVNIRATPVSYTHLTLPTKRIV